MQVCLPTEALPPEVPAVPALQGLFDDLSRFDAFPAVSELIRLLRLHPVDADELASVLRFDPDGYTRTRVFENQFCEVLLLGWLPGQASRIHDHGGSWGAVRIVAGEVAETRFETSTGETVRACETLRLRAGAISEEQPTDVHRLANASRVSALVTLHVYAPPLRQMRTYVESNICERVTIAMK